MVEAVEVLRESKDSVCLNKVVANLAEFEKKDHEGDHWQEPYQDLDIEEFEITTHTGNHPSRGDGDVYCSDIEYVHRSLGYGATCPETMEKNN
ncbi:hypothetical protein CUMW_201960 [Citrus unshiu]|nr:hypothetical protein CUMW_201960 [Citrus unshiu]